MKKLRPDVAVITAVGHLAETKGIDRTQTAVVWWLQSVRNTTRYAGFARRLAAWTVNRRADQAWVQCELERRHMTRYGLHEDFTRLMPTPVDVQWWRSRAADPLPTEFAKVVEAKAAGRPILVFPASLLPAKRHDTLLRATAIVKQKFSNVFVCCPGRFSSEPLKPLINILRLHDNVMFTESLVRQEAIPPLLCAADVHVFPSEGETYGKALIEAWCIGTPTVMTRVGVGLEAEQAGVARVGDVGDHESMARSIVEILSDRALAQRMRDKSRKWIDENYSFEAVGGRMIGLMRELVGRRGSRR
jgi:glycosyltransferase involved in cell wall biosynthesis